MKKIKKTMVRLLVVTTMLLSVCSIDGFAQQHVTDSNLNNS